MRALERLYSFSANKRFRVISNDFIIDSIGQKALEINKEIEIKFGLNVFEIEENEKLTEFENILNSYVTIFSNKHFGEVDMGDEKDLLFLQQPYSIERYKSFQFDIVHSLKPFLSKFSINDQQTLGLIKEPDFVSYVETDFSFYISKKVMVANRERLMLAHLTLNQIGIHDQEDVHPSQISGGAISDPDKADGLRLRLIMFFDFEDFEFLYRYPVRLFIEFLNLYGFPVEIQGYKKMYFRNLILPASVDFNNLHDYYNSLFKKSGDTARFVTIVRQSPIALKLIFLYSVQIDEPYNDFERGRI
jgi:hypothetical protein